MKRRNFLESLAGLLALPFAPKLEAKPVDGWIAPPEGARYKVMVDWSRDSVPSPDQHSVIICNRRDQTVSSRPMTPGEISVLYDMPLPELVEKWKRSLPR